MKLSLEGVNYSYYSITGTKFEVLGNMNAEFSSGEICGIFGKTGTGKTTLIQTLNGLIIPETGQVMLDGEIIRKGKKGIPDLRRKVGLVFQYPEHQIFEETIYNEVAYAIKDLPMTEEARKEKVKKALKIVNFNPEYDIFTRSPFELSGGEERKVAIASVLIMEPDIFVLDEPSAGLDPVSRTSVSSLVRNLKKNGTGVIIVTHDLIWALDIVEKILVLKKGGTAFFGSKKEFMKRLRDFFQGDCFYLPDELLLLIELQKSGIDIEVDRFDINTICDQICRKVKKP